MRRQDKYPDTATFHFHNENPKGKYAGDCVVRAIAQALNQSWEQTYRELTEVGIRLGCLIDEIGCYDSYLTSKGWIKCKQERKPNGKKYTGIEFCDKIAQKDKVYIIHIGTGHISVVVDKKVNDTWDCTGGCVGNYWIKA